MKKFILGFICLSAFFLNSCNKYDSPPPSNTDYITKSSWKFSSAKAGGIDVTAQIPACYKDNTMLFIANGNGTIDEGANVCSPAVPSTFTWYFQNNGTQINMSTPIFTNGSGVLSIVSLNDVNLVVSQNMIIPPSSTEVTVEFTFIH